jgi:hypothetical protein
MHAIVNGLGEDVGCQIRNHVLVQGERFGDLLAGIRSLSVAA